MSVFRLGSLNEFTKFVATLVCLGLIFFASLFFVGPGTAFLIAIFAGINFGIVCENFNKMSVNRIIVATFIAFLIHIPILHWSYSENFSPMDGPAIISALPIAIFDYIVSSFIIFLIRKKF